MYQLKKLKSLLLLLCIAVTAKAQLSNGKVYNFVNVGNTGKSMTSATAGNYLSIATTDESDYSQLWYCASDGNGLTLRNLGNGNYLRSPNAGGNTNWTLVKTVDGDNCRFSCTQESGHDVLRAINTTDSYHYMHYGSTTGTVVCWTSSAPATQWDFTEVSGITTEQLTANWEALSAINPSDAVIATYQSALNILFSDKACTELNSDFASMSETDLKEQLVYNNLPPTLQQMVLKVHGGDGAWGEENYDTNKEDWDAAYAKKYRVQLYEPYNEPEAAAAALGLNAHTNLNNPTGIFSGGREAIYVMVGGEIEEGASLYLASYSGHGKLGGYQNGVELKPGLNVVPSYFAGNNYCINYVVQTFNTEGGTKKGNKAKARKLSDYADLKIHIEGGYINGYWNKMGDDLYTPDKNADWDYIAARATQTDVTVLGEYITLQFPLHEALNSDGGTEYGLDYYYTGKNIIESSIQEWDNVMMWERIVLGVLDKEATEASQNNPQSPYAPKDVPNVIAYIGDDTDGFASGYDDYYNVHGLSFGTPSGYMYGGWDHCGYHFNTMGAIMTSMITDAGSHWGPAHEIGHQHQGLLTVNGLTEVTNNLFSNVVLWYYGKTTSRVNGSALEPIAEMFANEEADFFNTTSNVFITTQMYYKLFLYYHVLGHNPKFYPKLFEMLRQDPMSGGYNQRGATSILHFYKKCCEAAGEDLTEFFRAYGLFRVMTNRLVGDYANSVYDQTQEDIDDAIAEVKALAETKGWEENIAVLFINDDTGGQILSHRSDTEYLTPFEGADSELGSYATYSDVTAPNYTYTIVGTTVTMEGEGGIGFAIFNEKGELIGFSDNKTFEVSVECAEAIASGKAVVKTMKGDNETVEAVNIMDTDDTDAKRAMLGELVESAKAVLDLSDEDGTKVGFYRASYLEALESAYTQAKQVYEARAVASYSAVYNALFHEYFEVMNDSYARIGLVEGNAYRLTNKNYPERSLSIPTDSVNKQMMGEITDTESPYDQQLWYFEASETEGSYYLKNKNTSTYPGNVETSTFIYATATSTSDAHAYKLRDMGNGLWALEGNTALHLGAANYKFGVLGWRADATASQWYITAVDVNENAEALFSLQGMVEKTKDLAGEMANVQYSGKLALQAVSESEPYYLSTNACHNTLNNASDGQGLAGLLDDDTDSYFHSDYRNNVNVSGSHYLQVDLGSGNTMSKFAFNYTTRSNGNNCPTAIEVAGSNSADGTFTTLQAYTAASDGLPNGNALSWESPVIENTGNYRYLRFSITGTENSQKYFVMSTFGITNHETVVKSIEGKYSTAGLTEEALKDLGEELFEANELMASDDATPESLQAMCSSIENSYYTPLLTIYNNANEAGLNALKGQLRELINNTTSLIASCGSVVPVPEASSNPTLQTTAADGDYYVWTNAQSSKEGPISGLVDGKYGSSYEASDYYFHSAYSGETITDDLKQHHITINLGADKAVSAFKFQYRNRTNAGTGFPAEIEVYGSVDGTSYDKIIILNDMDTNATTVYTSPIIETNKKYAYLRFMVTKSSESKSYFHMAEFALTVISPAYYDVTLSGGAGGATEELLLKTYTKNAEAQAAFTYATTENQVEAAIAKLTAAKEALEKAKGTAQEYTVVVVGGNSQGGVVYGGRNYTNTTIFNAPLSLEVGDLTAITLDGYVVNGVALNGTTITVTYNKEYTVQVVGVDASAGGVKLGETTYNGGATFNMLESEFNIENFNAVSVEGYAAYKTFEGSTITVTYKKIYTVNVVGVDAANGGVTSGEATYKGGDTFEMLESEFNIEDFNVIDLQGYEEYKVFEGATITITYNKVYTIQVTGGRGNGAIAYDGTSYANGATLSMLETSFDESKLSPIIPDGYEVKEEIMVDDATGIISVVYAAIPLVDTEKYYTLECRSDVAHNTERFIRDNGTVINGRSSEASLFQFEAADDDNGYYIKSYVTGKYINHADGTVFASDEKVTVWTMDKPSHTPEARTLTVGNNLYLNNNGSDCTDNSCDNLQSMDHTLQGGAPGAGNACSLWTITEGTPLDMTDLKNLIDATSNLIISCYQNGNINGELIYFNSVYVTADVMATTKGAVSVAEERYNSKATVESEYTAAINALTEAKNNLTTAIANARVEANERNELKSQLLSLVGETETLIASCYENEVLKFINSEFVTEETISAIRNLVEAAEAKCSTLGTTATEFNASISELTVAKSDLVTAIENAEEEAEQRVQLKSDLQALVDNTNTLMALCGEIRTAPATTLSGVVGLQTTQPANNFYLSTNAQESTEGPIAGLTDDDASTFFHSSWKARMNEAHYLQVDMGEQYALKEFAFGYVTRDNGGGGPHPSTIVVSGSNSTDNNSFVELSEINSGLPTGGNESWSTTENVVTPKMPYRYLRFTVTLSAGTNGCKHSNPDEYFFTMSKFSLTAVPTEATPYADVYEKAGVVTEAQLLEVYYEKESAQSIINSANNTQLTAAKEALQAKYDALNIAYTTIDKSELEALLPEVEALINSCYTDETFNYTGSLYVTTELMTEVDDVITAARYALNNNVTQDDYDVALADLKNAQAELQYAVDHAWLPVILTTNIKAPVLYVLNSKRGATMALQYDPAEEHTFCIAEKVESSVKQAFFFMEGDAATQVYVYPFVAGEQVLSADNTDQGAKKVFAKAKDEMNKQQWIFCKLTKDGVDYYGLQPVGTNTYFSNYGGGSAKMGFYNTLDDGGSLFTFTKTAIEGSAAYHSLKVYYTEAAKVTSSNIQGGDAVGYYPEDEADAYNQAYATATNLLGGEASDYNTYFNAYSALKIANEDENFTINMPEVGKFYRFVSVVKGDGSNAFVYANPADNKMYWATDKGNSDATAIWKITPSATEGKYNISNLHTGSNINGFIYYDPSPLSEVEGDIEIESLSYNDGQIGLKHNGTMMHAQGGGAIVHWGTGANDGSAWRIVEVKDMDQVMHPVSITQYEHAGLYLNYPVTIPDAVKAYYLDGSKISIDDEGVGTLNLTEIEDEVIPARTAVILYAPHGVQTVDYDFVYAAAPNDEYDNLFTGSTYQTYREAEENHYYYVFGQNNGEIGLYKNGVKYDATGAEGTTHYKMSANKILFDWDNNTTSTMVKSFRFRLGTGGQTTSLEDALMMDNTIIYDLYGRRILEVKTSGLYIINGEKHYIHMK